MKISQLIVTAVAGLALAACSVSAAVPLAGHVQITTGTTTTNTSTTPVSVVGGGTAAAVNDLQAQFVNVVKQVSPSVVQVETPSGLGSGIVYDSTGDIVTNAHVVAGSRTFTITTAGGQQYSATLVGIDTAHDLAVIHTSATGLTPATFGDSSTLQVGDVVLALGSPYGLQGSVTEGLVSALNRDIAESRTVTLQGLIQTSAAINPGNSGGALVALNGQVMGIPTLGASTGAGIGFAIPSTTVVTVANQLLGV